MAELKNSHCGGQIHIADEVIAVIAGTAALEIDGVQSTSTDLRGGIVEMLGYKSLSKGVKVGVSGGDVNIVMNISAKFGSKIYELSEEVQRRVKNAIETMTGLNVTEVSVVVTGVHMEKDDEGGK